MNLPNSDMASSDKGNNNPLFSKKSTFKTK